MIITEFGRTPHIGKNGGRDHWPGVCPLVFAGGGLNMGQVIGESTAHGEAPATAPLGFEHLLGTIWGTLFDLGTIRLRPDLSREMMTLIEGAQPIPGLV